MAKKTYILNNKDVAVEASNAVYRGNIPNVDNAEDAIDNLNSRVAEIEENGSGGSVVPVSSPFAGKLFAFGGDSYTSPATWCNRMCSVLGATRGFNAAKDGGRWMRVMRYGSVNSAYSQAVDIVNNYINSETKPDYVLLMFGVNDAGGIKDNSSLLGEIDYGKVYYNTISNTTGEYDNIGFVRIVNLNAVNHIDTENPFWKYERETTFRFNNHSSAIKGCEREYLVDPTEWILDAECDGTWESNTPVPASADTEKLDLRFTTGGMQAAIAYLRYHLPNAVIKIGFTPMGIMLGWPNGRRTIIDSLCERMKEVADFYGVDYLETRHCGFSYIVEKDKECIGVGGHPSSTGQQRIGDYMARLLLANVSNSL